MRVLLRRSDELSVIDFTVNSTVVGEHIDAANRIEWLRDEISKTTASFINTLTIGVPFPDMHQRTAVCLVTKHRLVSRWYSNAPNQSIDEFVELCLSIGCIPFKYYGADLVCVVQAESKAETAMVLSGCRLVKDHTFITQDDLYDALPENIVRAAKSGIIEINNKIAVGDWAALKTVW